MARKRAYEEMFIDAAAQVVYEDGIENLRTKDVAAIAGFSEATMFRFFPSKELLLRSTFLYIDKQVSNILSRMAYALNPEETAPETVLYRIWHEVYRYLVGHPEETVCLIRYRYSSLYTPEVRGMRQAYNGGLEKAYRIFGQKTGDNGCESMINSIFEITLCFAENVITGQYADTMETENGIWRVVLNSIEYAKELSNAELERCSK